MTVPAYGQFIEFLLCDGAGANCYLLVVEIVGLERFKETFVLNSLDGSEKSDLSRFF